MTRLDNSFFEYSRKIAEKFLQSTVVIDDRARFPGPGEDPIAAEMTTPLKRPPVGRVVKELDEQTTKTKEEPTPVDPRQLNAKKVIDGFASKGIVCSVIKPYQEDRGALSDYMYQLASNADIIVIDWSMQNDDGEIALSLMNQIITSDLSERAQLRLIAVYTIDQDVERIPEKIKVFLEKCGVKDILLTEEAPFTIQIGSIRIVVLSKPGTDIPKEALGQQVSFEGLADRLTTEFTDMTTGLISNVVLNSLAEIRINYHKIITNFAVDLDAPYLTHRTLLPNPKDAEEHLVALIAAELSAILEEKDVKTGANMEAIKYWLEYKKPGDSKFTFSAGGSVHEWTKEKVIQLLETGISNIDRHDYAGLSDNGFKHPHTIRLSKMFHCDDPSSSNLDERFAELFALRSFYGRPNPRLTLGTIIKTTDDGNQHYVCIQPRCDCIRIREATNFLFLPLTIQTGGKKFDIILRDNGSYIRLSTGKKGYNIKIIEFPPNSEGYEVIIASEESGNYYFEDAKGGKYKWIGELRGEQAMRLSNEFAAELSRVGLNESEWLRRHAK